MMNEKTTLVTFWTHEDVYCVLLNVFEVILSSLMLDFTSIDQRIVE